MIAVTAPLMLWTSAEGRVHFIRIADETSDEIRAHAMMIRRGFGSVRVEATIGEVTWRTSVFPSREAGGYFLPVKIDVCRKAEIVAGNEVSLTLKLL